MRRGEDTSRYNQAIVRVDCHFRYVRTKPITYLAPDSPVPICDISRCDPVRCGELTASVQPPAQTNHQRLDLVIHSSPKRRPSCPVPFCHPTGIDCRVSDLCE